MNSIVSRTDNDKAAKTYGGIMFCLIVMVAYILYDYLLYSYYEHSLFSIGNISLSVVPMILIVGFSLCIILFNKINSVIFSGLLFVACEILITAISGAYTLSQLPFRAVEMFCWLGIFTITYYYAKKSENIDKYIYMILPFFAVFLLKCWSIFLDDSVKVYGLYNAVFYVLFFLPFFFMIKNNAAKSMMILLVFATVIMSYKRSAILVLMVAVAYYFWKEIGTKSATRKKTGFLIGAIVLVVVGVFVFNYLQAEYDLDWLARIQDAEKSGGSGRLDIWSNMWSAMKEQSFSEWLGGHGYRMTEKFGGAHNDFLEILYDFGIIGFALYITFITLLFRYAYYMKKYNYSYHSAYFASLILFLGYSFFGQLIIMPQWFFLLCLFWGLLIGDFDKQLLAQENK